MHIVSVSRPFAVSADTVWRILRDFDSATRWHPSVSASRLDRPQAVGCLRTLTLHNGATIVERLEAQDEAARITRYSIQESPLPVSALTGTLRVQETAGGCVVEWDAHATITAPDPAPVIEALRAVYSDGLAGLAEVVSARPA